MVNLFVSGYAGTDKLGDSVNFTTTLTTLRLTQNVTMWKQDSVQVLLRHSAEVTKESVTH